jgi:hypothetical protein
MWTLILIVGQGRQQFTANTKKEIHKMIPWTRIAGGKGRIQRLPGQTYLVAYNA